MEKLLLKCPIGFQLSVIFMRSKKIACAMFLLRMLCMAIFYGKRLLPWQWRILSHRLCSAFPWKSCQKFCPTIGDKQFYKDFI